jgi:RNA polymerase sigma-70 factor (ECF subfamily)
VISISQTDEALLLELRNNCRKAFEEIFKRYWTDLYRVAYARTKSREEGEEIVQEIFASLWKNRNTIIIENLSHYLFSAVRKRVISNIRSKIIHQKYWDFYSQFIPEGTFATDEAVEYAALDEAVENAIRQLPEKPQQIFRLNRLEGYSVSEISKDLNIPKRTIEHYLTTSIRALRVHLKDYILILIGFYSL